MFDQIDKRLTGLFSRGKKRYFIAATRREDTSHTLRNGPLSGDLDAKRQVGLVFRHAPDFTAAEDHICRYADIGDQ